MLRYISFDQPQTPLQEQTATAPVFNETLYPVIESLLSSVPSQYTEVGEQISFELNCDDRAFTFLAENLSPELVKSATEAILLSLMIARVMTCLEAVVRVAKPAVLIANILTPIQRVQAEKLGFVASKNDHELTTMTLSVDSTPEVLKPLKKKLDLELKTLLQL